MQAQSERKLTGRLYIKELCEQPLLQLIGWQANSKPILWSPSLGSARKHCLAADGEANLAVKDRCGAKFVRIFCPCLDVENLEIKHSVHNKTGHRAVATSYLRTVRSCARVSAVLYNGSTLFSFLILCGRGKVVLEENAASRVLHHRIWKKVVVTRSFAIPNISWDLYPSAEMKRRSSRCGNTCVKFHQTPTVRSLGHNHLPMVVHSKKLQYCLSFTFPLLGAASGVQLPGPENEPIPAWHTPNCGLHTPSRQADNEGPLTVKPRLHCSLATVPVGNEPTLDTSL